MNFEKAYKIFCALVLTGLVIADRRGWVLSGIGRGGLGRSYSAYNHK